MKLNFVHTIGGNLFYMGDAEDENAPMLEVRFFNEFAEMPRDDKDRIAARMFDAAMSEMGSDHKRGTLLAQSTKRT